MRCPELDILAKEIRRNAAAKGFKCGPDDWEQKLLLIIGEFIEAQEEIRAGHKFDEVYCDPESGKPEGFGVELADGLIRTLDLFAGLGLSPTDLVDLKMGYNATRTFMHGKQF